MEDRKSRAERLADLDKLFSEILEETGQSPQPVVTYSDPDPERVKSAAAKAGLPEPLTLADVWGDKMPEVAPELIEGVLRQGHKMIISAPSKAGKSFALMELAIAIAEGMCWIGAKCVQGRVLYINMEIDDASCYQRFDTIYRKGLKMDIGNHPDNITIWGLRGYSMPISKLAPIIIEQAQHNFKAIIIDPLYKVMDGDENSNSDVGFMVSQFDKIARETGSAVIYAHHFAKGTGGDRAAIDRGAGAGTFARDPDAILTMTQLDITDPIDASRTAWRMEYILREFPNKKPVSFWWEYPMHNVNEDLDDVQVETSVTRAEKVKSKAQATKRKQQIADTLEVANRIKNDKGEFMLSDFIKEYVKYEDVSRITATKRLEQAGFVDRKPERNGMPSYWYRPVNSEN